MKKNTMIKAFTLAEILLTMIIIGVISALTIPSLKNHSDEAKYVAATQKAMSEVAAAVSNIELIHGDASTWNFDSSTTKNWFRQTMNIAANSHPSWTRLLLSGESGGTFSPTFITADGMAWDIGSGGYSCGGGAVLIDINAEQPPNTIGIDIQGFRVGNKCGGTENKTKTGDFGVFAMGDNVNDTNAIWACSSYVIKHKKMPWLYQAKDGCNSFAGK